MTRAETYAGFERHLKEKKAKRAATQVEHSERFPHMGKGESLAYAALTQHEQELIDAAILVAFYNKNRSIDGSSTAENIGDLRDLYAVRLQKLSRNWGSAKPLWLDSPEKTFTFAAELINQSFSASKANQRLLTEQLSNLNSPAVKMDGQGR